MSFVVKIYTLRVVMVLVFLVPLQGVTVKPTRCPTNKIAPHKRSPYYGQYGGRTLGAFYELLGPGGVQQQQQYDQGLQERPQEDDPDDCGDIDDYDESDLSSLTQPSPYQGYTGNRFFFGGWNRPVQPQTTTRAPPAYRPPTPPYWSGGYFGNNHYRPPLHHEPSEYVKPVHEGPHESQPMYSPDLVGGPLGHVVGARPVRPTTRPPHHLYSTHPPHPSRYPPPTPLPTQHETGDRPTRPRMFNNGGILGSFVDLLFK